MNKYGDWPDNGMSAEIDRLRAEQVEAQLAKCEAERLFQSVKAAELRDQLAMIEEKWRLISILESNLERAEAERDAMRRALAPFAHYADAKGGTLSGNMLQALIGEMMERLPYPEHLEAINLFCKACQEARAALAPSPAGREG
jgi:hypothetical protein